MHRLIKWNERKYEMQISFIELKSIESAFIWFLMKMKKNLLKEKTTTTFRYVYFVNEHIHYIVYDLYVWNVYND